MEQVRNEIGNASSSTSASKQATIASELSKKIMTNFGCDKRIPNDTAEAVSEVLRMFVIEARARASIEVSRTTCPMRTFYESHLTQKFLIVVATFLNLNA